MSKLNYRDLRAPKTTLISRRENILLLYFIIYCFIYFIYLLFSVLCRLIELRGIDSGLLPSLSSLQE